MEMLNLLLNQLAMHIALDYLEKTVVVRYFPQESRMFIPSRASLSRNICESGISSLQYNSGHFVYSAHVGFVDSKHIFFNSVYRVCIKVGYKIKKSTSFCNS